MNLPKFWVSVKMPLVLLKSNFKKKTFCYDNTPNGLPTSFLDSERKRAERRRERERKETKKENKSFIHV